MVGIPKPNLWFHHRRTAGCVFRALLSSDLLSRRPAVVVVFWLIVIDSCQRYGNGADLRQAALSFLTREDNCLHRPITCVNIIMDKFNRVVDDALITTTLAPSQHGVFVLAFTTCWSVISVLVPSALWLAQSTCISTLTETSLSRGLKMESFAATSDIRLFLAIPLALEVAMDTHTFSVDDSDVEGRNGSGRVHWYTRLLLLLFLVVPKLLLHYVSWGAYAAHVYIIFNSFKVAAIGNVFWAYAAQMSYSRSLSVVGLDIGNTAVVYSVFTAPAYLAVTLEDLGLWPTGPHWEAVAWALLLLRFYGWYRGVHVLLLWAWRMLENASSAWTSADVTVAVYVVGYIVVCMLHVGTSIMDGSFYDPFLSSPACLTLHANEHTVFFLVAIVLQARMRHAELQVMQQMMRERQAFIRYILLPSLQPCTAKFLLIFPINHLTLGPFFPFLTDRYISHEIRTPLNTTFLGLEFCSTSLEGLLASAAAASASLQHDVLPIQETVNDIRSSCEVALNILNEVRHAFPPPSQCILLNFLLTGLLSGTTCLCTHLPPAISFSSSTRWQWAACSWKWTASTHGNSWRRR